MDYVGGFIDFLGLRLRVDIVLQGKKDKKATALYRGVYNRKGKLIRHTLVVNMGNLHEDRRTLKSLIAHELIHALQEEKALAEYHGPVFRKFARRMEKEFSGLKYLYIKGTDVK